MGICLQVIKELFPGEISEWGKKARKDQKCDFGPNSKEGSFLPGPGGCAGAEGMPQHWPESWAFPVLYQPVTEGCSRETSVCVCVGGQVGIMALGAQS